MLDLDDILIPRSQLAAYDDHIKEKAKSIKQSIAVDMDDERYGAAFRAYLLLSHWPELLDGTSAISEDRLLYNRYYWFMRFVRLYCAQHGRDAGLEQQAFQMLEQAAENIDWQIVKAIEARIEEGS